ncbi:hypothetical protein GGI05_005459, partial [Coemansia sp. RSA 2603]
CPAYALFSVCLWVDVWRAQPSVLSLLSDALDARRTLTALASVLPHAGAETPRMAHHVLPHDVALRGWPALAPVHASLRFDQMLSCVRSCCAATAALSPVQAQHPHVCSAPWDAPEHTARVLCARIAQLLVRLPRVRAHVRIPDERFCRQHADVLRAWAGECTLVGMPGMPLAGGVSDGVVVWADARLLGEWTGVEGFLVADEDDEDGPTAEDVPEHVRPLIMCALRWMHGVEGVTRVEIASDDEELAFYAEWFGVACVGSGGGEGGVVER